MTPRRAAIDADVLALEALTFLVASPDDLAVFMRLSGVDESALRTHAEEPAFLAGVLDYLLGDEKVLTRFCEQRGIEPATVHRLRSLLSAPRTAAD